MTKSEELLYLSDLLLQASRWERSEGETLTGLELEVQDRMRRLTGVNTIDEDGRVVCGGDTIMSGYADEPEMTASVLRGGEIYTADQGYIDSEGMLHLSGRMDDVINIGGYKVSPVEVEDAAYGFAQVKDCICVAHESDVWGVVLKLIVQTADGCALDRRGLARHLASRLERHKVPMVYEQADHIERTYNGKLNRKTYAEQK